MHLNFRRYQSKKLSFESILSSFNPKINYINICESHYQFNKKLEVPGYQCYSRNRSDKSQGGIANCVLKTEAQDCLKVSEGKDSNEFLITRHSQFLTPINIINVYGEQENRTPANVISDHWNEVVDEIAKIEGKGEHFILISDMNKHLPSLKENIVEKCLLEAR